MWKYWVGVGLVIAAVVFMMSGCSQQPAATATLIEDRAYPVTPATVTVKVGIINAQGQSIAMVDGQQEPTIKFAGYDAERLDPGHDATRSLEADVPEERFSFPVSIGRQ